MTLVLEYINIKRADDWEKDKIFIDAECDSIPRSSNKCYDNSYPEEKYSR